MPRTHHQQAASRPAGVKAGCDGVDAICTQPHQTTTIAVSIKMNRARGCGAVSDAHTFGGEAKPWAPVRGSTGVASCDGSPSVARYRSC
jgi:hypothetical protein